MQYMQYSEIALDFKMENTFLEFSLVKNLHLDKLSWIPLMILRK